MRNTSSDVAPSLKPPNKRVTMIKHVVGKVRSSSHSLPEGDFVFGIPNKLDEEGAGQGMLCFPCPSKESPTNAM